MFSFFVVAFVALIMSVHAAEHLRSQHDDAPGPGCFLNPAASKPVTVTIPVASIQEFTVQGTLVTRPGATYTGTQTTYHANAPINDESGNLIGSMKADIACQFRQDNPMPGASVLRMCQWTVSYTMNDSLKSSLFFALSSMNTMAKSSTVFPPGFNKKLRSYSADGTLLGQTYDVAIVIDTQGKAITTVFTKVVTSSTH